MYLELRSAGRAHRTVRDRLPPQRLPPQRLPPQRLPTQRLPTQRRPARFRCSARSRALGLWRPASVIPRDRARWGSWRPASVAPRDRARWGSWPLSCLQGPARPAQRAARLPPPGRDRLRAPCQRRRYPRGSSACRWNTARSRRTPALTPLRSTRCWCDSSATWRPASRPSCGSAATARTRHGGRSPA